MTLTFISCHCKTQFQRESPPFQGKWWVLSWKTYSTRGIVTTCPIFLSVKILAWTTLLPNLSIIKQVSLHNPIDGLRFLNRTIGTLTFNWSLWFRKSEKFIPCSISSGLMPSITESMLVGSNVLELSYEWLLMGTIDRILEFISSTLVFRVLIYNGLESMTCLYIFPLNLDT